MEPDFGCVEDSLSMENSITKLKNDKSSFPSVLEKYSRLQNERVRPDNAYKVFKLTGHCFGGSLVVTRLMLWFDFLGCQTFCQLVGPICTRRITQSSGNHIVPW